MIASFFIRTGPARTSEIVGAVMNLFLGTICLVCGLSGALVFVGTSTGTPFVVVGGILLLVGGLRVLRWVSRKFGRPPREEEEPPSAPPSSVETH